MSRMASPRVLQRPSRLAARLLLAGTVAACITPCAALARMSAIPTAYAAFEAPGRQVPLVSLPEAGQAILVDETRQPGGLRQRITFTRDGANRADLTLGTAGVAGSPVMTKPTKRGIGAELAALSDGPYQVLTRSTHNAYGPVGVALSGRCAYAWQWIDDLRGIEIQSGLAKAGRVSASLRVHLCGRGSTDALVADLARLRLSAAGSERITRAARRQRVRKAAENPKAPAQPVVQSEPAPVAPPLVTVNGSRTLVDVPPDRGAAQNPADLSGLGRQAVPRPGAVGSETLDQPRYLSDGVLARVPAISGVGLPQPMKSGPAMSRNAPPQAGGGRESLSTDLPAQAYRGPTPPPFGW